MNLTDLLDLVGACLVIAGIALLAGFALGLPFGLIAGGVLTLVFSFTVSYRKGGPE